MLKLVDMIGFSGLTGLEVGSVDCNGSVLRCA